MDDKIENWENMDEEDREWECQSNSNPVCPYCGHIHDGSDIEEFDPDEENSYHLCEECGKRYSLDTYVSISYTTSKMKEGE